MTPNIVQELCDHRERIDRLKQSPTTVGYSIGSSKDVEEYLESVIIDVETCIAGDYETHTCKHCKEIVYARIHR